MTRRGESPDADGHTGTHTVGHLSFLCSSPEIGGLRYAEVEATTLDEDKLHGVWMSMDMDSGSHFKRPGWFTTHVFNRMVAVLTRLGLGIWGSRVLEVKGRSSGQWRRTPVNLLVIDGRRYLVAPRGNTQWVRNLRASGEGRLRLGRHVERFTAVELADDEKAEILRAYLKRWWFEVSAFFDGVGPSSGDQELSAIAPKHPIFRLAAHSSETRA